MEQFKLNWQTYNNHLKGMMQQLMLSDESSDVTLVCEDRIKIKAHKFVLNACSPVFQSIFKDLPQKDPIIFLRGVLAPEMKSILQFMYLGQATLFQNRMIDFLNVAKSLEIKEISKDIECDVVDPSQNQPYDQNIKPNNGKSHEGDTIQNVNQSNDDGVVNHIDNKVITNEAGQYLCNKCDKQFSYYKGLIAHIKSAHEGIKFSCNDCNYKATTKQHLVIHIQSIHEGIKFSCNMCDFKAKGKREKKEREKKREREYDMNIY